MLKKLRLRFVLINMTIVTCMLVVILAIVVTHTNTGLTRETDMTLQNLVHGVQQPGDRNIRAGHFVIEVSRLGKVTVSGNTYYDLTDETFIQTMVHLADGDGRELLEDYGLRYMSGYNQTVYRIAFVDVSEHRHILGTMIRGGCLSGVVALAAFLVISILLAYWTVKPVEKAWDQQRQFVSDASHELKTPLTVIMSNAEMLQNPDYDEENKNKFANSILIMSRQMRNLVESLLELARADNGQVKKNFERLDLSLLAGEAMLPFEPVFFEKGLTLEGELTPNIQVLGSAQHLRQVLDILLDNAAKYTQAGVVHVQLQRQGRNNCLLTVANPGQPIPQEDLEQIFERFYRIDSARSRTGSFGLGLPIARAVIQEHGGKIWAQSNDTGNCFCVLLPCIN